MPLSDVGYFEPPDTGRPLPVPEERCQSRYLRRRIHPPDVVYMPAFPGMQHHLLSGRRNQGYKQIPNPRMADVGTHLEALHHTISVNGKWADDPLTIIVGDHQAVL